MDNVNGWLEIHLRGMEKRLERIEAKLDALSDRSTTNRVKLSLWGAASGAVAATVPAIGTIVYLVLRGAL